MAFGDEPEPFIGAAIFGVVIVGLATGAFDSLKNFAILLLALSLLVAVGLALRAWPWWGTAATLAAVGFTAFAAFHAPHHPVQILIGSALWTLACALLRSQLTRRGNTNGIGLSLARGGFEFFITVAIGAVAALLLAIWFTHSPPKDLPFLPDPNLPSPS